MTHNIIILGRVCCPECLGRMIRQYGTSIAKDINQEISVCDAFCEFCG